MHVKRKEPRKDEKRQNFYELPTNFTKYYCHLLI